MRVADHLDMLSFLFKRDCALFVSCRKDLPVCREKDSRVATTEAGVVAAWQQ